MNEHILIIFVVASSLAVQSTVFVQNFATNGQTNNFKEERSKLIYQELSMSIGGQLRLDSEERKVDIYLKKLKKQEVITVQIS